MTGKCYSHSKTPPVRYSTTKSSSAMTSPRKTPSQKKKKKNTQRRQGRKQENTQYKTHLFRYGSPRLQLNQYPLNEGGSVDLSSEVHVTTLSSKTRCIKSRGSTGKSLPPIEKAMVCGSEQESARWGLVWIECCVRRRRDL